MNGRYTPRFTVSLHTYASSSRATRWQAATSQARYHNTQAVKRDHNDADHGHRHIEVGAAGDEKVHVQSPHKKRD